MAGKGSSGGGGGSISGGGGGADFWFQVASFVLVGMLWGCSNAVLKRATTDAGSGSKAMGRAQATAKEQQQQQQQQQRGLWDGLRALFGTKAAAAYLVNQSGSLVYYYLLGSYDISLAVPICNSLTFVFTALTSHLLGEAVDAPLRVGLGCALVLAGVSLCVTSQ